MKFKEIEIEVVDFVSDSALAMIGGGTDGSGEPL